MDTTADYLALRRAVGAVALPRDVVTASGPDTAAFLQGQLSQDVSALADGDAAFSLLLSPQGKLDAWVRVGRTGPDTFVLDTDAGWGEPMLARLGRFKLRTRCDLELRPDWRCVALRGPDSVGIDGRAAGAAIVAAAGWPALAGVDLLGPDVTIPDGVRACGLDAYHDVRIECGVPAMGAELEAGTIPAEAGIVERSVSWTKGCYTGQELVARIESRGNHVARRLLGVVVGTNVLPPVGATLHGADGDEVGHLTSVGESLDRRSPVALAYVRRAVTPPADLTIRWPGGEAPARVEALPLV
jgi:folate-binding protein YgfZ